MAKSMHASILVRMLLCALQVGGLGDVVSGLSKACLDRGHHVQVIMPFYECLDEKQVRDHAPSHAAPKAARVLQQPHHRTPQS